jgi:hypothetical protein
MCKQEFFERNLVALKFRRQRPTQPSGLNPVQIVMDQWIALSAIPRRQAISRMPIPSCESPNSSWISRIVSSRFAVMPPLPSMSAEGMTHYGPEVA